MKKYDVIRKIRNDENVIINENIKAYLYTYRDIDFAIYSTKEYKTTGRDGYISIIRTCNDKNGLSFNSKSYKTIKECYNETIKIIDKCYKQILNIMEAK